MDKVVIYQVFTRLFGNRNTTRKAGGTLLENGCGKMNDFDARVLEEIKAMGVTHIWYTGLVRHATCTDYSGAGIPKNHPAVIKGEAGSPYAICDYYDIDPDLAVDVDKRMAEFEALIKRSHKAGLKVIMDFVPNHVAREYHSIKKPRGVKDLGQDDNRGMHFSTANNFYYCVGEKFSPNIDMSRWEDQPYEEYPARATGNDRFTARPDGNDWYETVKLNYGIDYNDWSGTPSRHFDPIPDTWNKMTDILLFWARKGVDAFRCDMAEMVPAEFWAWATDKVRFRYPKVQFIGEVYNPSMYRTYIWGGFDYLYDKVGMYDCVRDVICGRRPAMDITRQWQNVEDIKEHMLYFLENHDEQRVASDFFAGDARKGVPGLIVSALLRQNPLMIYFGQELGERGMDVEGFSGRDGRTTIFDYWSLDSLNRSFFTPSKMRRDERTLREQYVRIMNIAHDKCISQGEFFDLMYVNPGLSKSQYAFLRKHGEDVMLVVTNFSDRDSLVRVDIPSDAFQCLKLREGRVKATDLLTERTLEVNVTSGAPMQLTLPKHGGIVLKWRQPKESAKAPKANTAVSKRK